MVKGFSNIVKGQAGTNLNSDKHHYIKYEASEYVSISVEGIKALRYLITGLSTVMKTFQQDHHHNAMCDTDEKEVMSAEN